MDAIFSNLMLGFDVALTPTNIMWVFIGGLLGTVIGMLPGLGPATGVAVLIPITYGMNPATALITMCAVYYGAMFGGSRASIMINTPGDSSAIVSCFDGYPMTKNGQAGPALAISAIASFIGGTIGMVFLVFLTQPVASVALKFGPAEMFSLMIFALTATVTLSEGSLLKGFISMGIGYGLVLDWLGYLIATFFFMMIVTTLINVGRHKQNLIISVLFSVISFISFALLLKLSLPRGLLGGILPF